MKKLKKKSSFIKKKDRGKKKLSFIRVVEKIKPVKKYAMIFLIKLQFHFFKKRDHNLFKKKNVIITFF